MIIKDGLRDTQSEGIIESKKANLNVDKISKLQYILTEGLYADPESAVIVEICNNAVDSIIESGKDPIKNPVIVNITNSELTIEDKGIGMDKDFFENQFMSVLTSTKEEKHDQIGHFGIGGKSWASLNKAVTFIITKDSKRLTYLCYKGAEFIEYELLKEETTNEENGVLFKMPIQDSREFDRLVSKAKQKLSYYDTVCLVINQDIHENSIIRHELFQYSSDIPYNELHLCLKDVVYPLDFKKLGISTISIPIALRFGLEDGLIPTPSRENILYNTKAIEKIKERIVEVSEYFVQEYNLQVQNFDNFVEAFPFINTTHKKVIIQNLEFSINTLIPHSQIVVKDVKIKDYVLRSPSFYKLMWTDFMAIYSTAAYYTSTWKRKHIDYYLNYTPGNYYSPQKVLVNESLRGYIKTYLQEKYVNKDVLFVTKSKFRTLKDYAVLLNLKAYRKDLWRSHIQEWLVIEKQIENTFIKELDIQQSKEYTEWYKNLLEKRKLKRKENKEYGTYEGLNKQKGEITLYTGKKHSYNETLVFDKKAVSISKLEKLGKLSILLSKKEKENLEEWWVYLLPFVNIIYIGERDLKHFKQNKHIITMATLKYTKPFARIATSILAEKALKLLPKNTSLLYDAFPKYMETAEQLQSYRDNNIFRASEDVKKAIIQQASDANTWDFSIYYTIKSFMEICQKYKFLDYIVSDTDSISRNMIYILSKHNKINNSLIEDYELVPKVPVEVYSEIN